MKKTLLTLVSLTFINCFNGLSQADISYKTYTVTTSEPYGNGSFGEAITAVNALGSKINRIEFNINNEGGGNIIELNHGVNTFYLAPHKDVDASLINSNGEVEVLVIDFRNIASGEKIVISTVEDYKSDTPLLSINTFDRKVVVDNLEISNTSADLPYMLHIGNGSDREPGIIPHFQIEEPLVILSNIKIENNYIDGGGLFITDFKTNSCFICNSIFKDNETFNSCLWTSDSCVQVYHSKINLNSTENGGGAATFMGSSSVHLCEGIEIIGNATEEDNNAGAIYCDDTASIAVHGDVAVTDNFSCHQESSINVRPHHISVNPTCQLSPNYVIRENI